MHGNPPNSKTNHSVPVDIIHKAGLILYLVIVGFAPTGCSCFNSRMDAPPNSGVPPYSSDDPEASGNPARAWYN